MKSARKNTELLDEGCQYIEDLMLEDILSRGSLTTILLNEVFTSDDFNALIKTIKKQIQRLPERMSNTRASLTQAVTESQAARDQMIASRKGNKKDPSLQSKHEFARVTAEIASMGTTLQSVIEGLKNIKGLQDGNLPIEEIEQLVRTNFKPQGLFARLFGGGGEAEYFGLTSELFIDDIRSLSKSELLTLLNRKPLEPEEFISKDDAATLVDKSGLNVESKEEDGELILEKWRRMAGITGELK